MNKLLTLLGTLALVLAIGGSANAGYWEVTYDLAGSTLTTTSPLPPPLDDPLTGKFRMRYSAATKNAPITGRALVAGTQHVTINQDYGAFALTGITDTKVLATGGVPANVAGANTLSFPTTPNSVAKGFNHCTFGACSLAGFSLSVPNDLSDPNAPYEIPNFIFTGPYATATKFTSTDKTQTASAGAVTLTTVFKGTEVSRYYISGDVPAMSGGALAGLAAFLVLGGTSTLALRNRRG